MAGSSLVPTPDLRALLQARVHRNEALEVHFVAETRVSCQGVPGPLGHPKVYYDLTRDGFVECGYCDRIFVYDPAQAGTVLEGGQDGALIKREFNVLSGSLPSGTPAPADSNT